jgi:hypothetical protein
MTDKAAPDCRDCRHLIVEGLFRICGHARIGWVYADMVRENENGCGPSGRHFEPREDTPAE